MHTAPFRNTLRFESILVADGLAGDLADYYYQCKAEQRYSLVRVVVSCPVQLFQYGIQLYEPRDLLPLFYFCPRVDASK
jgi:hypothetical protein